MVSWDRAVGESYSLNFKQFKYNPNFRDSRTIHIVHISHTFKNDIEFPRFFDSPALHRAQFTAVAIQRRHNSPRHNSPRKNKNSA
jgi:hypothetical protein